jgi:hypothetical protein
MLTIVREIKKLLKKNDFIYVLLFIEIEIWNILYNNSKW